MERGPATLLVGLVAPVQLVQPFVVEPAIIVQPLVRKPLVEPVLGRSAVLRPQRGRQHPVVRPVASSHDQA